MGRFCIKCGNKLLDNMSFCPSCGFPVNENNYKQQPIYTSSNFVNITKRDILLSVILSILTCGIYSIYWFIVMTDDSNEISDANCASGVLALIYTILTCGIYNIYWNYQMGKKLYEAGNKYGKNVSDNSLLYLILTLCGLSMVNYCIIQSDLNKFAE